MCLFQTQSFSCGCASVTGVDRCTMPACRPTLVYAGGWLYVCSNKYGGCHRLALSERKGNQTGKSGVLATVTCTDSNHDIEKKSEPSQGTDFSRPILTTSKDEWKEAVRGRGTLRARRKLLFLILRLRSQRRRLRKSISLRSPRPAMHVNVGVGR